ncbi:MAG: TonB-dependent receptor [Flavobacteriaceae bacterium]|nr:TonB-dependent receptor [Flavobacteriaceae bacterium]
MTNLIWIDALKLRANYGTSGNDRIGDFSSFNNFSGGFFANYSGQSGLIQFDAGNPNLKWERSRSWDIGLDAAFLNNRISVSLDYYKKTTDEMILAVPIPQTNGIEFILDNVGEMENRGFEIDLRTVNVANETIRWETSLNLGFNTNEVISLPGANLDSEGRRFIEPETAFGSNQRAIEGHSINTFYMIRYKGVNPDTGDAEWLDRDGNPTTTPTASDRVIVGDASPDLVGGFRNTVTYKHWDLNFFFNFSLGNDIYLIGSLFTDNTVQPFNKRAVMLDIWEQPGDQAYVPSVTSPTFPAFSQPSTLHLRDGSYARLKNITLGYNVPNSVLDKLGFVNGVRLYATANNLLTIRDKALQGVDPETTGSIANGFQGEAFFSAPQSRTFLTGIQINF